MPRRRGRGRIEPSAEINVTSLVDVVLTLLVIFMITAPMLQGGVEVSVPRARTESVPANEGLIVSVDRQGAIYIGDQAVPWEQFESRFPQAVRERQAQNVYLRADQGVAYGQVVRVLGAMKASRVATVGLIAEPEAVPGAPR
jgi:biopolymer transport protein ExbD/biopolymer transport protein TolR